jgi:hypothetical protein
VLGEAHREMGSSRPPNLEFDEEVSRRSLTRNENRKTYKNETTESR